MVVEGLSNEGERDVLEGALWLKLWAYKKMTADAKSSQLHTMCRLYISGL